MIEAPDLIEGLLVVHLVAGGEQALEPRPHEALGGGGGAEVGHPRVELQRLAVALEVRAPV